MTPYKGFVFNSKNIITLLNKLNGFVVATNLDNLTDLKIYKINTFNAKFPNLLFETSVPDRQIKGDDESFLISSIGTGTGKVMLHPKITKFTPPFIIFYNNLTTIINHYIFFLYIIHHYHQQIMSSLY